MTRLSSILSSALVLALGLSGCTNGNGAGLQGPRGAPGPTGPAGATGPAGSPGSAGPTGPPGFSTYQVLLADGGTLTADGGVLVVAGPMGAVGPTGAAGLTGPSGAPGATGPTGPVGIAGPMGPAGAVGATGPSGLQGIAGVSVTSTVLSPGDANCPAGGTSFTSVSGTSYACNGAPGDAGAAVSVTTLPPGDPTCPSGGAQITAGSGTSFVCNGSAANTATYRWFVFNTYTEGNEGWLMANSPVMFGGVNPSTWTDSNATAAMLSPDKEVLRTLFTQKGYARANANVFSHVYNMYSSTNGEVVGVMFRVKNSSGAAITWSASWLFTAYNVKLLRYLRGKPI